MKVKCVNKAGLLVSFLSDEVSFEAEFTKQEDADYFTVNVDYVVVFTPAGGDLVGEAGTKSQSGG